ncbi:MAG: response regulator transcription factor [Paraclostridium sp.]
MIKVIIADDDDLIRESLKIILSIDEELDVIRSFKNGEEAMKHCLTNDVDIALLDVRMPIMNGVEATKDIASRTDTKVIILTTFDEDEYISKALKYGAKGYLLKNNPPENIINTIKMVYRGNSVIQQEVLEKVANNILESNNTSIPKTIFTEREIEVIKAIAEGLSNKEIAGKLYISEGTVKNYISSILSKTNLNHRTQIAIKYIKGTLLS